MYVDRSDRVARWQFAFIVRTNGFSKNVSRTNIYKYNAFWEREKKKRNVEDTFGYRRSRDSCPQWHTNRRVNPHQVADFIIRQLIIGSLTVYRWFIDVNERRRENIAP